MITCINQEVIRHEISYYLPAYFIFLTSTYVTEHFVLKLLQCVFYRLRRGHVSHHTKTNAKLPFTHPMPFTSEFWKRDITKRVFEMNNSKTFPDFILLFSKMRLKSVEQHSCPSNIIYSKISPKHVLNRTTKPHVLQNFQM